MIGSESDLIGSSLPDRQLRKVVLEISHNGKSSLPDRQLRKIHVRPFALYPRSLPDRQLRKIAL